MGQGIVITIDGPAGVGKSTSARLLARRLGFTYIETGALYRSIAWLLLEKGIVDLTAQNDLLEREILDQASDTTKFQIENDPEARTRIIFENQDISSLIRQQAVEELVPIVAQQPKVRSWVTGLLRKIAKDGNFVVEGRDMGTVIFPDAPLKFFLQAEVRARAQRRYLELRAQNIFKPLDDCNKDIQTRDQLDMARDIAPLVPADDAMIIDTTNLTIQETIKSLHRHITSTLSRGAHPFETHPEETYQPGIFIAVSGPIGVGKTTLCSYLRSELLIPVFQENPDDNPFLHLYYSKLSTRASNPWAFPSQMWFLWRKHELLTSIKEQKNPAIIDRTLHEDYMFAKLVLAESELKLYEHWYRMVYSIAPDPDFIISLEASLSTLGQRIQGRKRPYEKSIPLDFLAALHHEYIKWISEYSDCPVIRIDTESQDLSSPDLRKDILDTIKNSIKGGIRL